MAAHQAQHRVASTLQRNVEVRHKRTRAGAEVDNLIGEQVGLNRRDTVSLDSLHSIESTDKVDEALPRILAEVADVHPRNHNLLATLGSHLAGLGHKRLNRATAAASTRKRNSAIAAEVVATILYLQEIARAVATRAARAERPDILSRRNLHLRLARSEPAVEISRNFHFLLTAKHNIHPINGSHLIFLELGIAARHHNHCIGIAVSKAAYRLAALLVGKFSNTASIHHTDVGHLTRLGTANTTLSKNPRDSRSFSKIKFAPQCVKLRLTVVERR